MRRRVRAQTGGRSPVRRGASAPQLDSSQMVEHLVPLSARYNHRRFAGDGWSRVTFLRDDVRMTYPDLDWPEYLFDRATRTPPVDCHVVPGGTPVVSFGHPLRPEVATLGINPSRRVPVEGRIPTGRRETTPRHPPVARCPHPRGDRPASRRTDRRGVRYLLRPPPLPLVQHPGSGPLPSLGSHLPERQRRPSRLGAIGHRSHMATTQRDCTGPSALRRPFLPGPAATKRGLAAPLVACRTP